MSAEIVIQLIAAADVPEVAALHKAAYAEAYVNTDLGVTPQLLHDHVYDDQYGERSFSARLDEYHNRLASGANARYVAAWLGSTIVGFGATLGEKSGGYLDGLYVHPAYQGRGVGRLLLRDAEAFASGPLSLHTVEHAPALGFYTAYGYRKMDGHVFYVPLRNGPNMKLVELSNE